MPSKDQPNVLLFNKWDVRKIEIRDPGLHNVISLNPSVVIPITFGRHEHQRMKKAEVHIVERLANKASFTLARGTQRILEEWEARRQEYSKP